MITVSSDPDARPQPEQALKRALIVRKSIWRPQTLPEK